MKRYQPKHMRASEPYWRGATRRLITCGTAALVAGAVVAPTGALAAEWVSVDSTTYDSAYGTESDPWMWDGGDNLTLNGYQGGSIVAAGKLDVAYKGDNTITGENYGPEDDPKYEGVGISVEDGDTEEAELTVKGDEGSSLSVSDVQAGLGSAGDVTVKGSGKVTIDTSKASESSVGIYAGDKVTVSDGADVTVKSGFMGVWGNGVTIDGSSVNIDVDDASNGLGASYGISSQSAVTIQGGSNVKVTSTSMTGSEGRALGIVTSAYGDDGSDSDATPNADITIRDSVVSVTAKGSSKPDYAIDGSIGIGAVGGYGVSPTITIDNSTVKVSSSGIAIMAASQNYTKPGSSTPAAKGTIVLKDAKIVSPSGARVESFLEELDKYFELEGDVIAVGDSDNWEDNVVSDVTIESTRKADGRTDGEGTDATVEQASVATASASAASLAATGDATGNGLASILGAGIVALAASIGLGRRKE